jgi:DNA-binding LytR/AlgR family response regulator
MKKMKYPDFWLRLIGIPLLAAILWHESATEPAYELLNIKLYYLDFTWSLLMMIVLWESNRFIIGMMDRRYSWIHQRFERFVIQSGLLLGISFVEIVGLQLLYNVLLLKQPIVFSTIHSLMVFNLPLSFLFVLLINLIYTGMYMVHYHQIVVKKLTFERDEALQIAQHLKLDRLYNEHHESKSQPYHEHLIVNSGFSSVPILSNSIAYIFKFNEITCLKTFEDKEYSSNSSLENLEAVLNPTTFFRINRQILVHVSSIKKFKADVNGKLEVEITPSFSNPVYVSKKKAPEFREWIGKKI